MTEDDLIPVPVGAGTHVAAERPRDCVLQSSGRRLVIGMGFWLHGARLGAPGDLGLERADRPARVGCAPREDPASVVVRFGEQRLTVAFGQHPGVDEFDRLVGKVQQADSVCDVGAASTELCRQPIVAGVHGLDVIPAARELAGVEMSLVGELGRERFLRDALESVQDAYEHVVIDTPPNLGLLTVNALVCAPSAGRMKHRYMGSSSCARRSPG